MTAPSLINGEWVIPDTINEDDCPEIILLKKFEIAPPAPFSLSPPPEPQPQPQTYPQEAPQQHQPKPFTYTGAPHPLAQRGLEKLLQPPPDCESQLIQPKKLNLKRYSDSSFYQTSRNVYPTIDEQKELCKLISATLFSDENKDSRGRDMFQNKLSKIEDFSLESQGQRQQQTIYDQYLNGRAPQEFPQEFAAPIKTFLAEEFLTTNVYTSNEFSHYHSEQHALHQGITPDQAYGLIQGLKNDKNRGAEIFEQRRQTADKWVVDETNVKKAPPRPVSPTIHKMMEDMNRPLQESYAATLPAAQPVYEAPKPKPVDMSVDLSKIQDPIEILEMALKDQGPDQVPAPVPAPVEVPAAPVEAAPEPEPEVPAAIPEELAQPVEPAPEPAPAVPEPVAPAHGFRSSNDLTPYLGQGPSGWKSIKPAFLTKA